jgi:predicted transcriptional regulator
MNLGPLEKDIMEIFWNSEKSDARTVCEKLNKSRDIAYTTVNTTLSRLYDKKLLKRRTIKGRGGLRYVYWSADSKNEYVEGTIRDTIDDLLSRFGKATIQYFSDNLNLSKEEVKSLERRLEELQNE